MTQLNDPDYWSPEKEHVLKKYAEESECMYIAYTKEFVIYRGWGFAFTIPSIIISTVTGLISFDQNFSSSSNGPYIIGALNIAVAVMGTIYKVLKYGDYESQFKFLAGEHLKLFQEIQATLFKSREERDNALEFMRKVESRRAQLFDDAPVISEKTRRDFKKKYKNTIHNMPLVLNKINPIQIYGEEEEKIKTPRSSVVEETTTVNISDV